MTQAAATLVLKVSFFSSFKKIKRFPYFRVPFIWTILLFDFNTVDPIFNNALIATTIATMIDLKIPFFSFI